MVQHSELRFLKLSLRVGFPTHLIFSISLLFIGEYTTTILLQIIYILLYFSKFFIYLYMLLVHFILIKLFSSSYYLLYFFNLLILLYSFIYLKIEIDINKIFFFIFMVGVSYFFLWRFDENIYDIYILLNINDKINYISNVVEVLLLFLHTLILFIYLYNKKII